MSEYVWVRREPTKAMIAAGGAALKRYLDALPAEERAKLKPRKSRRGDNAGYKLSPQLKARLRWAAMLEASS